MRITRKSYSAYIKNLASKINGQKFYSPVLLNNETLIFPIMDNPGEVFVISLNFKNPLVYKTKNDLFFSSFENSFIKEFRKNYGKTVINNLNLHDNDNVIEFNLTSIETNKSSTIYIELFSNSPNMILTSNGLIEKSYFLYKNRTSKFGEKYTLNSFIDLSDGNIEFSEQIINEHFANEIELRSKEKYSEFLKFLNSKIKATERKIEAINGDVKKADELLLLKDVADNIFGLEINLKSRMNEIEINGKNYQLDPSKTVIENCEIFYKKSKKAKETISRANLNIENSVNELNNFISIKNEFENQNEEGKDKIILTYKPNKKHEVKKTEMNRPWKYNLNGTYIYFGRNASQNDYLSFIMKLDREFTWLHIKDKSGAHLVIANKKPTENELLFACEFALICSHCKTGEIVYTKKKSVRKGHTLGEAILKNYQTIKLNKVREETIKAFENIKRCD